MFMYTLVAMLGKYRALLLILLVNYLTACGGGELQNSSSSVSSASNMASSVGESSSSNESSSSSQPSSLPSSSAPSIGQNIIEAEHYTNTEYFQPFEVETENGSAEVYVVWPREGNLGLSNEMPEADTDGQIHFEIIAEDSSIELFATVELAGILSDSFYYRLEGHTTCDEGVNGWLLQDGQLTSGFEEIFLAAFGDTEPGKEYTLKIQRRSTGVKIDNLRLVGASTGGNGALRVEDCQQFSSSSTMNSSSSSSSSASSDNSSSSMGSSSSAAPPSDLELGKSWYESSCAGCHGLEGQGSRGPRIDPNKQSFNGLTLIDYIRQNMLYCGLTPAQDHICNDQVVLYIRNDFSL